MLKGLYTAYTGMINEQHRMDVLTNNLANADTVGFKKEGTTSQAFDNVLAYKIKDLSEAGNLPKLISTPKAADENEASFENIKNSGKVEVTELTPEERQKFVDALQPVYDEFSDDITPELLEGIRSLK